MRCPTRIPAFPPCLALAAALIPAFPAHAQPCQGVQILRRGPESTAQLWPRNLRHPSATYDPVDGRTVVIGVNPSLDRTQVWEWNGSTWRQRIPDDGIEPPPLIEPAVAYHEDTGRIVLFGGTMTSGEESRATWLWDGYYWGQPIIPDTPPIAVHGAGMIYSRQDAAVILIDGLSGQTPISQVASWSVGGAAGSVGWRILSTTPGPDPARTRNAIAFDKPRQRIIFADPRGDSAGPRGGVWELAGTQWTQASASPAPGTGTGSDQVMAADPDSTFIVRTAVGGPNPATQPWYWDGEFWFFNDFAISSLPARLEELTSTTDTRRGKIIILGRQTPSADLELWEFDSTPGAPEVSAPTIEYGASTAISITASGAGDLSYQWRRDGIPLEESDIFEATRSPTLAISTLLSRCDTSRYDCLIISACGETTSPSVELHIPFIADFNIDGGVDGTDIEAFFRAFAASDPFADVNCDGGVDGADVEPFFLCWMQSCG